MELVRQNLLCGHGRQSARLFCLVHFLFYEWLRWQSKFLLERVMSMLISNENPPSNRSYELFRHWPSWTFFFLACWHRRSFLKSDVSSPFAFFGAVVMTSVSEPCSIDLSLPLDKPRMVEVSGLPFLKCLVCFFFRTSLEGGVSYQTPQDNLIAIFIRALSLVTAYWPTGGDKPDEGKMVLWTLCCLAKVNAGRMRTVLTQKTRWFCQALLYWNSSVCTK